MRTEFVDKTIQKMGGRKHYYSFVYRFLVALSERQENRYDAEYVVYMSLER
jgi:hypothetical protein